MDLGLSGKAALVGGASRGIGRAVAFGLAREGCRVAICARGAGQLDATAEEIRAETGAEILAVPCDMARQEDIARFVAATVEAFGALDIVVNNAGGPPPGPFQAHDDVAWEAALSQNFLSVVRTVREALPYLKASQAGRIINITSVAVKEPIPGLILSNAARLGVVGLAKTLSRELGPDRITVNNVCPGLTLTGRMRELYGGRAEAEGRTLEDLLAAEGERIPLGHFGQPEDVAALIVFLASAPARHITGTTIQVDGGSTAAAMLRRRSRRVQGSRGNVVTDDSEAEAQEPRPVAEAAGRSRSEEGTMLEGELVKLRALEPADVEREYAWINDREVTRYLVSGRYPLSRADEQRWLEQGPPNGFASGVRLAIETKDSLHIGNLQLSSTRQEDRKAALGVMIGDKEYWSNGYGMDAVVTLLRFAFEDMNLHRVWLTVLDFNARAIACYHKCGFQEEARLRDETYKDGAYHDVLVMGVLRDEFEAMHGIAASREGETHA